MHFKLISQYHPAAALHSPRLLATLNDDWEHFPEKVDDNYVIVPEDKLDLAGVKLLALDTETNNAGGIGQWSIAYRQPNGQLTVTPFYGPRPSMSWGDIFVGFHNAKYDLKELASNKMSCPKNFHDTMILSYCMGLGKQAPADDAKATSGANMVGGLGLKYLIRRHLGMTQKTWNEVKDHPEWQPEYNAKDSVGCLLLMEKWLPTAPKHYFDIDMPLLPVLMAIEDRGMHIDQTFLGSFGAELDRELAEIKLPLNPNSPKQVGQYIYGTLGITPWKFTETKEPSTDSDVLEKIDDPICRDILRFRELAKDKGTYIENYQRGADARSRIHPELKQTSTSTARLSCARPNLQNVDKRGVMRKLFDAPEGFSLVRMDFKLLEFGALAILAGDEKLIYAFQHGDVHQQTADAMGIDRDTAKHINFLMQNGGSAWGMATTYGLPIETCKGYFDAYHARFPALKRFQDETVEEAKLTKHVVGYFGRRRRVDALLSSNWKVRQDGEKEAKTYPMQNLGAEICKLAMIDLHYKHQAPMTNQVHDELLIEVPTKDALDYAHWIKEYVPKVTPIKGVEFPVEVSVGANWWECMQKEKEIK